MSGETVPCAPMGFLLYHLVDLQSHLGAMVKFYFATRQKMAHFIFCMVRRKHGDGAKSEFSLSTPFLSTTYLLWATHPWCS